MGKDIFISRDSTFTVSGWPIYIDETNRQNHLREKLLLVHMQAFRLLELKERNPQLLRDAVEKLKVALLDPRHYGDNSPESFFDGNIKVVPDPRFDYEDLFSFGVTGEEGFEGFQKTVGFDKSLDWFSIYALIALLLIDSAVQALNCGDFLIAGADSMAAADAVQVLASSVSEDRLGNKLRKEFASAGGKARHKESEIDKQEIIKQWQTGIFKGNKSAAGRWAYKTFGTNHEVAKKWIRDYEKTVIQQAQI